MIKNYTIPSCFFLICFFGSYHSAKGQVQHDTLSKQLDFSRYLIENQKYEENLWHLNRLHTTPYTKDSIPYLKGLSYYYLENYDEAMQLFRQSSIVKSQTLGNYMAVLHQPGSELTDVNTTDKSLYCANHVLQKANSLLSRDLSDFPDEEIEVCDSYRTTIGKLDHYYKQINQYPNRSPLLAAVLSGVLPGAGKFYAGSPRKGLASLLATGVLAAQTVESYQKRGPAHYRTIVFGALFSVFYVGNIWGSVLEVEIKQQEFDEKIDRQILLTIHYPLSRLF